MDKTVYCDFCGKSQHEVRKIIAGQRVFICNECAALCMELVKEADIDILSRRIATFLLRMRRLLKRIIRRTSHG